jgi:hypothetical protein
VSLAAGSRLGPYEILSPIGVGGMGVTISDFEFRIADLGMQLILAMGW